MRLYESTEILASMGGRDSRYPSTSASPRTHHIAGIELPDTPTPSLSAAQSVALEFRDLKGQTWICGFVAEKQSHNETVFEADLGFNRFILM